MFLVGRSNATCGDGGDLGRWYSSRWGPTSMWVGMSSWGYLGRSVCPGVLTAILQVLRRSQTRQTVHMWWAVPGLVSLRVHVPFRCRPGRQHTVHTPWGCQPRMRSVALRSRCALYRAFLMPTRGVRSARIWERSSIVNREHPNGRDACPLGPNLLTGITVLGSQRIASTLWCDACHTR
jgi:hypothetical protein